jgi:hypothetical protein
MSSDKHARRTKMIVVVSVAPNVGEMFNVCVFAVKVLGMRVFGLLRVRIIGVEVAEGLVVDAMYRGIGTRSKYLIKKIV